MAHRTRPAASPTGWRRVLFRAPLHLYRWHLGGLLGARFCLLTHAGRSTGLPRQAVVEVVDHDRQTGAVLVASGFGPASQWYRNIEHDPHVTIRIGGEHAPALACPLSPDESGRAMARYASAHPRAARKLMDLCGISCDGSKDDYYQVGRDFIPFVRITPIG